MFMSGARRIQVEMNCDVRCIDSNMWKLLVGMADLTILQEERRQDPKNKSLWTLKFPDLEANGKGHVHEITNISLKTTPWLQCPPSVFVPVPTYSEAMDTNEKLWPVVNTWNVAGHGELDARATIRQDGDDG